MVYTVTFNCALDYVLSVPSYITGATNRADTEQIFAGGKGINVSRVLTDFGVANTAMGFTAGFTGAEVERLCKESGIKTDFIRLKEGMTRINVKIKSDEETEINGAGSDVPLEAIDELIKRLDALCEGDILVLAGSVPRSVPHTIYGDIAASVKSRGVKVVCDAEGKLLLNVLTHRPFLVKPNHHELGAIFDAEIHSRSEAAKYAVKLREMGARNVLVSLAGEGAVLACENGEVYESAAPKGSVINSAGAGDSMTAGFIAAYLKDCDFEYAFKTGICAGSACAFSDGTATLRDTEQLYQKYFDSADRI